jgi:hypothetical protein
MGKTPNGLAWIYSSTMFIFDTWSSSRMIQQAMMVKNHSLYWKYVNSQNLKVEALTGKHLQLFSVSLVVVLSITFALFISPSSSLKTIRQTGNELINIYVSIWRATSFTFFNMMPPQPNG